MISLDDSQPDHRTGAWIALGLCAATVAARTVGPMAQSAAGPVVDWTALAATGAVAVAMVGRGVAPTWLRVQQLLRWCAWLMMIWLANGLPFDLLRLTRLIPLPVDWAAVASRSLAFAAVVALTRLLLARRAEARSTPRPRWPAFAAFALALPYPVMRTIWALGGTLGLNRVDAGGHGWLPWLACIPWLMAAALSLLLIASPRWMPRRLLVGSGWFATGFVALVGPGACWVLVTKLAAGAPDLQALGMAAWVPCLFYGSWLLWAVAAGAATYSYQLRTAIGPAEGANCPAAGRPLATV
jgi:hypothetical protein